MAVIIYNNRFGERITNKGGDGGGGRIRTFEVDDGRFTVCSLWPLGNPTWGIKILDGAGYRNRTGDLLITSQLLYLLS